MSKEQVFHLLTKEYNLILATNKEDFLSVKEIRKEILLPKYQNFATIEDEDLFLFNDEDKQSFINNTPQKTMPMEKYSHSKQIKQLSQTLPVCEISRLALSNKLIYHEDLSVLRLRTYLSLALMIATRINAFLYHYSTIFSIIFQMGCRQLLP